MKLEQITKQYGMVNYLDNTTGNIYQLSKAIEDDDGTLLVPVVSSYSSNLLIGYARMEDINGNTNAN